MALKDQWVDIVDGVDTVSADDINQIAHAVIDIEKDDSAVGDVTIEQNTGYSETSVMSQKAVTEQTSQALPSTFFLGGQRVTRVSDNTVAENSIAMSDGIFVDGGQIGWCYCLFDVFNANSMTIDTTDISDSTITNFYNSDKEFISNYNVWAAAGVDEITSFPVGTRYVCISCQMVDADKVIVSYENANWHKKTEQILSDVATGQQIISRMFGDGVEVKLSDFDLTYGGYILGTGAFGPDERYCYGYYDISNNKIVTITATGLIDTMPAVVYFDEHKNYVSYEFALVWAGDGVYICYPPYNAKYICISSRVEDISSITISIESEKLADKVDVNHYDSLHQDAASSYTRTDRSRFIKGLHLDCGRKYFSVANIKTLLDEAHVANLNTFQIYFSDHEGFRFGLDDMNVTVSGNTYDLSIALGDGMSPTDGSGKWLTQSEMDDIINYAHSYDIDVIPAFDMPGHFGAIHSKFSEEKFRPTTKHGQSFMVEILRKYATYFANKGCRYYNICGDESNLASDMYESFMNEALHEIAKLNMTPLFYNDEVCKDGSLSPYLNNGGIVLGWNRYDYQAEYRIIDKSGYRMINAAGYPYYWVLNEVEKADNLPDVIRNSDIFLMADGSKMYNIVGAMYHIWCDLANMHGADNGDQVIAETADCIAAFGEAVNRAVPNDFLHTIESPDGSVFRVDVSNDGTLSATKL